ncbi:MAG: aminotransferase class IV [Acidobacteria bacterium]|nr:aminotransferase class IV [Acidobacteriota bacterium]
MIWRDGQLCQEVPICVPPADVEGVMTTLGCDDGRPLLWERHRRRLLASSAHEGVLPLQQDLESLLEASGCMAPSRLRISVWRDSSSEPIRVEAVCSPIETFGPGQKPVWLGVVHWQDPPPADHKVIARRMWHDAGDLAVAWGADDALIADGEGRLLETSKANVFVRRGSMVATPPAPERCLPGIMRQVVLEALPSVGLNGEERDVFIDELVFADEVWITNAVVGVVRVGMVGERSWDRWPFHRRLSTLPIPAPGWP